MRAPQFPQHYASARHSEVQPHRIEGDKAKYISSDAKYGTNHQNILNVSTKAFNQNRRSMKWRDLVIWPDDVYGSQSVENIMPVYLED